MDRESSSTEQAQSDPFASALPSPMDSYFHELWSCGHCGREFGDCTSVAAHEEQCGGRLARW